MQDRREQDFGETGEDAGQEQYCGAGVAFLAGSGAGKKEPASDRAQAPTCGARAVLKSGSSATLTLPLSRGPQLKEQSIITYMCQSLNIPGKGS